MAVSPHITELARTWCFTGMCALQACARSLRLLGALQGAVQGAYRGTAVQPVTRNLVPASHPAPRPPPRGTTTPSATAN